MNREIKFRVWDILTEKMVDTGFHVIGEVTVFGLIDQYARENRGDRKSSLVRYDDFIIMQFTGLKDKSGKEIYEGDITNFGTVKWFKELTWDSGGSKHPGFYFDSSWGEELEYGLGFWDDIKVIDNIFENPELLNNG